ncbi:MAG: glycosyltransferase family 2 protein [Magnetococcales bacterium]|nr:glycosyltransferase family 2 protein [Magnetococcales bacterium]MBF0150414.1 glycosyltransferase family 2 protein [Magnetococcales bacterium]MBF0346815.1 glycosyltransferase family 2 protein [Magnetococcales bacterium]MBF0632131.1 glycosyltransferase family 2 protein [Magnetococcales bacterium]
MEQASLVGSGVRSLAIVMPGYNVANTVQYALGRFSQTTLDAVAEIVFINNNSKDATLATVRALQGAKDGVGARLTVIDNQRNFGLGGSLKVGIRHVLNQGHDAFMILHSDDQGDNEQIAGGLIARARQAREWDVIMASRFVPGSDLSGYDRKRILGNRFFNLLTALLVGVRMSDAGTGIMLVRSHLLRQIPFAGLTSNLQFNPMLNILMYKIPGVRILEVPLQWHDSDVASTVVPLRYVLELSKILLLYRMRRMMGLSGFPGTLPDPDWIGAYPHKVFFGGAND